MRAKQRAILSLRPLIVELGCSALSLLLLFAAACASREPVLDEPIQLTEQDRFEGWEPTRQIPPHREYDEIFEGKDYEAKIRPVCPQPDPRLNALFCRSRAPSPEESNTDQTPPRIRNI